ncbi:MAG: 50S ribosomal protein L17 [Patescibacteria group bacterium]
MRKNVFGRKFKRDKNERSALFKSLLSSLVLNERIKTTEQKAKAIKAEADKLVTKAKGQESQARKLLAQYLTPSAMNKMISNIAPGFKDRNGGYTRIVRVGNRFSDNASMVVMEWVERSEIKKPAVTEVPASAKASAGKQKKKRSVPQKKLSASEVARKTSKVKQTKRVRKTIRRAKSK